MSPPTLRARIRNAESQRRAVEEAVAMERGATVRHLEDSALYGAADRIRRGAHRVG